MSCALAQKLLCEDGVGRDAGHTGMRVEQSSGVDASPGCLGPGPPHPAQTKGEQCGRWAGQQAGGPVALRTSGPQVCTPGVPSPQETARRPRFQWRAV